ncbi:TPA: restriction endonuclease subunit S [Citrobacter freundii]|uniref:methylation-associated defense system restriction endonuclease subunit S MAD5 n=1 Tax=Citrobacter freundii TaxID=546 RepID=UPI0028C1FF46|nr:restriction endonuclease subunit S [Citrobacter freundii]
MSRKFQCRAVPSSWLENNGRRLDCGPYMSGAIEAKELLKKIKTESLSSLTSGHCGGIYNGPQFVRNYVDDPAYGVPFLTTSTMLQADMTNLPMISAKDAHSAKLSYLKVEEGMTLITCSGSIGRMAYARKDMTSCWSNQDIMKVVADPSKISPGYLYAYLSSRFGVPIVISGTYGAVIQHIEAHHIADLPVPRLGNIEDKVNQLILKAADLRSEAISQVITATSKYIAAAGLNDISAIEWHKKSGKLGFAAALPNSNSLRAVNFIPLNKELESYVKTAKEWAYIGDLTKPGTFRTGPRFKRIDSAPDPEFGVELLGQRDCFTIRPDGRWLAKKHLPKDELMFLPEGSTMIAARGGLDDSNSFARCQFITGKRTQYAYSQDFLRVIPEQDKILPGCLFAFLRSEMAFRMLRGYSIGSIQQEYHPEMVKWMPVPLIDQETANRVNELIVDAYRKYDEAIDCEDQAQSLIERAIEEGGR